MKYKLEVLPDAVVSCENCEASCCRQDAMLFNDTEVPDEFIEANGLGGKSMARLVDGWCAALNRKTMRCNIYQRRPWICREFEIGGDECLSARAAKA